MDRLSLQILVAMNGLPFPAHLMQTHTFLVIFIALVQSESVLIVLCALLSSTGNVTSLSDLPSAVKLSVDDSL